MKTRLWRFSLAETRNKVDIKPATAFLLFTFGAAIFVVLLTSIAVAWSVTSTDMIRTNPNRSVTNALWIIPIATLFIGFWKVVNFAGALLLAGCGAAFATKRFGFVPLWSVLAMLPLSLFVIYFQDVSTPTATFFMDAPDPVTPWDRVSVGWLYAFAPALLLCWIFQMAVFRAHDSDVPPSRH